MVRHVLLDKLDELKKKKLLLIPVKLTRLCYVYHDRCFVINSLRLRETKICPRAQRLF